MSDQELTVLQKVVDLLASVDEDARKRIHRYVTQRFTLSAEPSHPSSPRPQLNGSTPTGLEVPGVALLTDDGSLRITVRDLKARNAIDAAKRLTYVAIAAFEQLTGSSPSSRKIVTPILKDWRLYDGNTRHMISADKGILRSGDSLSLDLHARNEAEHFMSEIVDEQVTGTWRPSNRKSGRAKASRGEK